MNAAVISGLLVGYGIAMPVGAIAVFLIRLGATACLCIGAAAGLGAATVDGGVARSASWQLVLVSGGALTGRLAGSRRGMLAISLASSLLIAGMAFQTLSR